MGKTHRSPLEGGNSPVQTYVSISRRNLENGVQMDKDSQTSEKKK